MPIGQKPAEGPSNQRFYLKSTKKMKGVGFNQLTQWITWPDVIGRDGNSTFLVTAERYFLKEYYTVACYFDAGGVANAIDRAGLNGAMRRITGLRTKTWAEHLQLVLNQESFVKSGPVRLWAEHFKNLLSGLKEDDGVQLEGLERQHYWADLPMPKRKMRLHEEDQQKVLGTYYSGGEKKYIDYHCKPGEFLPRGKSLRAVGDIGVQATVQSASPMSFIKNCFAAPYRYGCGVATFTEHADDESIRQALQSLHTESLECMVFVYHSDDSSSRFMVGETMLTMNIDISKCDGSNYSPIFDLLFEIGYDPVWAKEWECAFQQCMKGFRVKDVAPSGKSISLDLDTEHSELGHLQRHVLYSGSVLTTAINNVANMCIFIAIMTMYNRSMTKEEVIAMIPRAAAAAGYIVTVDVCQRLEDAQFLKHSLGTNTETLQLEPYKNLGVWMKSFGAISGDFPGSSKLSIEERAKRYLSGIVESRLSWGGCSFTRAFLHFCDKELKFTYSITDESVMARYRMPPEEYYELCDLVEQMQIGDELHHPGVLRIMYKDYAFKHEAWEYIDLPDGGLDLRRNDDWRNCTEFHEVDRDRGDNPL